MGGSDGACEQVSRMEDIFDNARVKVLRLEDLPGE